jgi:hypothetical protein
MITPARSAISPEASSAMIPGDTCTLSRKTTIPSAIGNWLSRGVARQGRVQRGGVERALHEP